MKENADGFPVQDTDDLLQDQAQELFQTWQDAAREWSSIYGSLEDASGKAKAKRMKQLQALEQRINCIADQYELARQSIDRMI